MEKESSISKGLDTFFEKIEKIPKTQRILIGAGVLLVFVGAFVYFSYLPKHKQIGELTKKKETLEKQLRKAKNTAAKLKYYQDLKKKAEDDFKVVSKALPEKEEIPTLLASISKSGKDSGLEFLLFQPTPERKKDFTDLLKYTLLLRKVSHTPF